MTGDKRSSSQSLTLSLYMFFFFFFLTKMYAFLKAGRYIEMPNYRVTLDLRSKEGG